MDFSNTFKSGTRGFKKKAVKKVQKEDQGVVCEPERDLNNDLEDANMLGVAEEVIEIPRNLTITQDDMKVRK